MKSFLSLFFILYFTTFSSFLVQAQKGSSFYLVDDLDLTKLSKDDKFLLDSLLPVYHKASHDTDKINVLGRIVESCNDEAVWPLYNKLMEKFTREQLSKKTNSKSEQNFYRSKLADAINNFGFLKINEGEVDGALADFSKSFEIQKEAYNKRGMAHSLSNMGYVYKNKGDILKALDSYDQALKYSEEAGDKKGVANLHNNIGLLYKTQGETEKALENYLRSLSLWKSLNNTAGMSAALNNLAFIYSLKGDMNTALSYYRQSLQYDAENGDNLGYANSLNNIGLIYEKTGRSDSAVYFYTTSLGIFEQIKSKKGLSEVLTNLAKVFYDKGEMAKSEEYCLRALAIARELGYPVLISDAASLMYDIYKVKKEWKKATEMQDLFSMMKDSILNNETQKAVMRQQLRYQFEKKEAIASMERQKQQIVVQEEKKRQRILTGSIAFGLFLMIIFAGFIYNRYRISKRQQDIIARQKQQVDLAYDQLSEKNREIIDSIHYAKRIQTALLKEQDHVSIHLPEHFILFKPKDIVSGDFYWSYEREGFWYVAAGDCTGHGVPGAFLTMLGTAFLNEIVNSKELLSPAEILNRLRDKIVKELSQSSANDATYDHSLVKDGMDMSLLMLDLSTGSAEWSGANNGLLIFKKGSDETTKAYKRESLKDGSTLLHIQPDKQPIGYYHNASPFTNHKLQFSKGDTCYLFTDGYADQFGGPQGKKMKFKAVQQMLVDHQAYSLREQKEMLSATFDKWKGSLEQVDDVTMIGVRI